MEAAAVRKTGEPARMDVWAYVVGTILVAVRIVWARNSGDRVGFTDTTEGRGIDQIGMRCGWIHDDIDRRVRD